MSATARARADSRRESPAKLRAQGQPAAAPVGEESALEPRYGWEIEQFHRALKTGGTDAEAIGLRTAARVERWVALHSAVAMRLVRLSYLGRQRPEAPASEELSEAEERALCAAAGWLRPGGGLSVGQAVAALASLGGYVGPSSGGPPGFEVLGRGLQAIGTLARVLAGDAIDVPPTPPRAGKS